MKTKTPFYIKLVLLPAVYGVMILKILIAIPVGIIALCNYLDEITDTE